MDLQGADLEQNATKSLELLTQQQNTNGQGLDEELKKIKFYNLEVKKSVDNNVVECKKNLRSFQNKQIQILLYHWTNENFP